MKYPIVAPSIIARVLKQAKAKGAVMWQVMDPLQNLESGPQLGVLVRLFSDGKLTAAQPAALEAASRILPRLDASAWPDGLGDAALRLLADLGKAPVGTPGLFPGYSVALDTLLMHAFAQAPALFEHEAPSLKGTARLALESVRLRHGRAVPESLHPEILTGFARAPSLFFISSAGELEEADEQELEGLALRLGDQQTWTAALIAASDEGRPLSAWLVRRLPPAQLARLIESAGETELDGLDADVADALLRHAAPLAEWVAAIDQVSDEASSARNVLGLVVGAKLAEAGGRIPKTWPLMSATFSSDETERIMARALFRIMRHLPAERALGYAKKLLASGRADAMVALAAHLDASLARKALAEFDGETTASPMRGRLLAALGKPLPEDRLAMLDALLGRCELAGKRLDAAWLELLPLDEELSLGDAPPVIWTERQILLEFPELRRSALVLASLRGSGDGGHVVQLLTVLSEDAAADALEVALLRASPPPGNWLDYTLEQGSAAGVTPAWTRTSLLSRLEPHVMDAYLVATGRKQTTQAKLSATAEPAPDATQAAHVEKLRTLGGKGLTIRVLVRATKPSRSCLGGNGGVATAYVPKLRGEPMDHVLTIELKMLGVRVGAAGAVALSLFVPDMRDGDFSKARVVWVPKGGLKVADGTSVPLSVVPLELAANALENDEVNAALRQLSGYAGGQPQWVHGDETPKQGRRKQSFLFQVSQSLAGAHLNLGEGTLYVFEHGDVVLQN